MKTKKQIGVWMDHSIAHLIEQKDNSIVTNNIESEFTHEAKEHSLSKGEDFMHSKEQHLYTKYYKKITDAVKSYNEILLFGPTTAKEELSNLLKTDRHFENVKIDVKHADKMTENQQHAFVKGHFHIK